MGLFAVLDVQFRVMYMLGRHSVPLCLDPWFSEARSHFLTQADLELMISQHAPLHPATGNVCMLLLVILEK